MRKTGALLLVCFVTACGREAPPVAPSPARTTVVTPAPTATPTPEPTSDPAVFDLERTMDHVRALAVEIGKREAGTEGDRLAAAYIADELGDLGWTVTEQKFDLPQGGRSSNIIGASPGFDPTEPYVIVGGHRDSLRGPGANDNATGVAVVLDIARAMAARPGRLPVVAIAFGAEERQPVKETVNHVGSRYYVSKMSASARENLAVMVNLDMVGRGSPIMCGRLSEGPREGTQRCLDQAKKLGIAATERVAPDWSDHGSFQREGMNIAWLWTGDVECCFHNPRDTIDIVRPDDLRRSGLLGLAIVRSYTA